ncbi:methyltransferase domain-containing protein [Limibaculum sp. FT325]|uniref:methyltransferase domain-containing protein n=1 Tax=Thermohalobaculum sediminis TaxID=2939436 RepID=UPI0020BD8EAD|nr:methyltransferase domain-containing protein [Limibaculum sediminis]MCL5777443.1 methyltransferase domain-containing protein [Limibaculum sediminis]
MRWQRGALDTGLRPAHLATDTAGKWGVWQHALDETEKRVGPETAFLDLDCTKPLRLQGDIDAALDLFARERPDMVESCTEARKNPYFNLVESDASGALHVSKPLPGGVLARQQAPVVYEHVGVVYDAAPDYLKRSGSLYEGRVALLGPGHPAGPALRAGGRHRQSARLGDRGVPHVPPDREGGAARVSRYAAVPPVHRHLPHRARPDNNLTTCSTRVARNTTRLRERRSMPRCDMTQNARERFKLSKDDDWLALLSRSVHEPLIDGFEMPRFPHGRVQRQFIGSADGAALNEGFAFYRKCRSYFDRHGLRLAPDARYLDFGCGWGRFPRIFWYDFDPANIHGVDVDPEILAVCRALGCPGTYTRIEPRGRLPFDDGHFDFVSAYSVFSHLPEEIAGHWMSELSRVTKPGGMMGFTTEARRFLDFIERIEDTSRSNWHFTLAKHKARVPEYRDIFDQGRFVYIPTGGGAYRSEDVYGEACIPESYIRTAWSEHFALVDYVDDPSKFWQAFVIVQKPGAR